MINSFLSSFGKQQSAPSTPQQQNPETPKKTSFLDYFSSPKQAPPTPSAAPKPQANVEEPQTPTSKFHRYSSFGGFSFSPKFGGASEATPTAAPSPAVPRTPMSSTAHARRELFASPKAHVKPAPVQHNHSEPSNVFTSKASTLFEGQSHLELDVAASLLPTKLRPSQSFEADEDSDLYDDEEDAKFKDAKEDLDPSSPQDDKMAETDLSDEEDEEDDRMTSVSTIAVGKAKPVKEQQNAASLMSALSPTTAKVVQAALTPKQRRDLSLAQSQSTKGVSQAVQISEGVQVADIRSVDDLVSVMNTIIAEQQKINAVNMKLNCINLFSNYATVTRMKQLQTKCNVFEREIAIGKKTIANLSSTVSDQQGKISTLRTNVSSLKSDLDQHKVTLKVTTDKYFTSINELQQQMNTQKVMIEKFEATKLKEDFALDMLLFLSSLWTVNTKAVNYPLRMISVFLFEHKQKYKNYSQYMFSYVVKFILMILGWNYVRGAAIQRGFHANVGNMSSYSWKLIEFISRYKLRQ